MTQAQYFALPDGRRLAFRHRAGRGPTLVFLPGYLSDMAGGKASALWQWAEAEGRTCLLLDYSGCGLSDGDFADGTLSRWRDELVCLLDAVAPGDVVLIGSSMGGWLMLLLARALGARAVALVGIASAPDFTDWGFSDAEKARLADGETIHRPNSYGYDPTPTHALFWADGEANQQLAGEPIPFDGAVRLIHGQRDEEVPHQRSLDLAAALRSDAVQVTLVKDGDHRLSRQQDIALILRTVGDLLETLA